MELCFDGYLLDIRTGNHDNIMYWYRQVYDTFCQMNESEQKNVGQWIKQELGKLPEEERKYMRKLFLYVRRHLRATW